MKRAKCKRIAEAEAMWLQGNTIEEISKALSVNVGNVCNWASRYRWSEKREEMFERMRQTLYAKLIENITENARRYLRGALLVSQMSVMALEEIYKNVQNGETTLKRSAPEILQWANILSRGSVVHKNVVPDANEKVSEKILSELRAIKDGLTPKQISVPDFDFAAEKEETVETG